MAITGTIYGSTSNQYIDAKIEYSYIQDDDANTSTVTATLYFKRNNSGYTTSGAGTFYISVGGSSQTINKYMNIGTGWADAGSATRTISHNDNGEKTITISASGSISGTTLTATSCSGTVKLNTIPRASTIAAASNKTLGNYCNVIWVPLSASFRYKLKFTLGGWTYTTGAIHPNKTTDYIYTGYQLPLDVAKQFPNSTSGTMSVTLYTYSDSNATTQVGSASSKSITVTVPNNSAAQPAVTMSLTPVHFKSLGDAFNSVYVQGKSKVQATLSATGKYDATIRSYSMVALGKTDTSSPYQTDYLSTPGTVTITGKAIDSRGYTGSTAQDITVIAYSKPKIIPASGESAIICARCDSSGILSDSGTYLKIKAKRSYSKVISSGTQKNFCSIRYRYKAEGATSYSSWVTILASSSTSSDEVETGALLNGSLDVTKSYTVQIGVVDTIGEENATTAIVPTDKVYMERAGDINALAIGKYAEVANCVDIAEDWLLKARGGIEVAGVSAYVVEQGTSGIWSYRKWSNGFAECWGTISANSTFTNEWGSLYACDPIPVADYPFEFVARPTEIATGRTPSLDCWLFSKLSGGNTTQKTGQYAAARPTMKESVVTISIDLIVRGRWK